MAFFDVWPAGEGREYARYFEAPSPSRAAERLAKESEYELPLKICICVDDGPATTFNVTLDEGYHATKIN